MRAVVFLTLLTAAACGPGKPPPPDGGHPPACFPRVGTDLAFDIDIIVGTLSGTVTVSGAAMPDSPPAPQPADPNQRGYLVLTDEHGARYELPLGRSGPAHFSGLVFGGTYQVDLRTERDTQLAGLPRGVIAHLSDALTLAGDKALDFDLPLVNVDGTVTQNGAPYPDGPMSRGVVGFNDVLSGSRYSFDVGATGPARYQGQVFGGTYDVTFVGGALNSPLPPYAPISLERGLTLSAAASKSYDVATVAVSGTITLGGTKMPDSPALPNGVPRGTLVFTDLATQETYPFLIGATGPATWSGTLPKSSFKVVFASVNNPNLVALPPYQFELLDTARAIGAPGTLDFDLTLAPVSGTITLAGAAFPDSPSLPPGIERAYVIYSERTSGTQSVIGIGPTGPATYSGLIFAGDYDIAFSTGAMGVVGVPPALPAVLELGAHLGGPKQHDYDLQLVDLTVNVELDGGEIGDGGVSVSEVTTGYIAALPPAATPGAFKTQLFAGPYDVVLSLGNRGQVVLQQQLDVAPALAPISYGAQLEKVSGTLTLDGKPIPDGPRGSLLFSERLTHWPAPVVLDQTGPARFEGTLLGAQYDVRLLSDVQGPAVGMPASVLTQIATGCSK